MYLLCSNSRYNNINRDGGDVYERDDIRADAGHRQRYLSFPAKGTHRRIYTFLGAHVVEHEGESGTLFAVWAPCARGVSVIGNFNSWNKDSHRLAPRWDSSGIWEGFIPGVGAGEIYKYAITTETGAVLEKCDPLAFFCETAARDRRGGLRRAVVQMGRRGVDGGPRGEELARRAAGDIRAARRLVAARATETRCSAGAASPRSCRVT